MREHCGVSGVLVTSAERLDAVEFVALAHQALDHRGQDGAGIAVWDGENTFVSKGPGRTKEILQLDGDHVSALRGIGNLAIGHNRYGTDKNAVDDLAVQPFRRGSFAQAHNGQIKNNDVLGQLYSIDTSKASSDSEVLTMAVAKVAEQFNGDIVRAYQHVLPNVEGAFSLLASHEDKLIAIRDRHGIRPLVMGRLPGGSPMFASENTGLKAAGAQFEREVLPGEMVVIDGQGNETSTLWTRPEPSPCLFEYVYFSKGTNFIGGKYVNDVRTDMGRRLFKHAPVEADVVIDVPASGEQFALGYAEESGIPYGFGFIKNYKIGRSFIGASQSQRQEIANTKLTVIPETVAGKRVVMIDDSIVRGTSIVRPIEMLRQAGATEVHVRIPSDKYQATCEYGVDTGNVDELLAARMGGDLEAMRQLISADSLDFLPLREMMAAVETEDVCSGCMGGNYPAQDAVIEPFQLMGRLRSLAAARR